MQHDRPSVGRASAPGGAVAVDRPPAAQGDHPPGLGVDSGPSPLVRAAAGLVVGLAAGVLAAALTPRPHRAVRTAPVATGPREG